MNNAQKAFCNLIYNQLKEYAPQYGIYCYSAIIAQAIIESNWGKSELSAKYFNFFGINRNIVCIRIATVCFSDF